jgi:hypothetical protein
VGQPVSKMSTMRTTSKKQAIKDALYRLGLPATAKAVAHALMQQGVLVVRVVIPNCLWRPRADLPVFPAQGRHAAFEPGLRGARSGLRGAW